MPHNRWMPTDRRVSPLRVVAAVSAMTAVMLLVAALGEWAILPSATLRELDEVAYLRFASVYQAFESLDDFEASIRELRADHGDRPRRAADDV